MEPYNTCQHGRDIEGSCRECDKMLQRELDRIRPKQQTAWLWLMILSGLSVWLGVLIWRLH